MLRHEVAVLRRQVGRASVVGRYRFHDLVRAYAVHLVRSEDAEAVRRTCLTRLLDHYVATSAAAMDVLYPAEMDRRAHTGPASSPTPQLTTAAAVAWLDTERANLIAACAHTIANDRLDYTIRFSAILRRYLQYGGYQADGLAVHTQAPKPPDAAAIGSRRRTR